MFVRPPWFFFNDTATSEIYTLSLHDALPIARGQPSRFSPAAESRITLSASSAIVANSGEPGENSPGYQRKTGRSGIDRKSTRLNSSHANISYAVFCLKTNILLI